MIQLLKFLLHVLNSILTKRGGHPIIGDRRYGADDKFERQIRLYSFYLRFKHPVTQEWVELKKELPSFFLHLPAKNENYK